MSFAFSRCRLSIVLAVLAAIAGSAAIALYTRPRPHVLSETDLFYAPTPPVRIERVLTESAPTTALVLALPDAQAFANTPKGVFFLRLIEVATQYVTVVILVNRDESQAILRIRGSIAGQLRDADRVLKRITFIRGVIDTEWIRDYGPLFGLGVDHQLVLLDNIYRDIRGEAQTERTLRGLGLVESAGEPKGANAGGSGINLSDYGEFWRRNDDAAPVYFNDFLYLRAHRFAPLVRPPMELSGGDLAFTEDRQMFTSMRTLELNGGDERRFRRLAREYFNVDRVNYLRPLPNSIWHIDMFFSIASPRAVILGEFPEHAGNESEYLRLLRLEATETLEWNRALIVERLPGVEVIRVPMPPIIEPANGLSSTGQTGIAALDSAVATNGARLKALSTVVYRSFINSVFINGGRNRSAVLVPGFTGLEELEKPVGEAYRRAYPGADIRFINADALAEDFGGIHCVTLTIPSPDSQ